MDAVDTAMVSDSVYADADSDADKESKANAVLGACAEGWGMTAEKQTATNNAVDVCNALAACNEKAENDPCGENMVCKKEGELLVCKAAE